VPDGDPSAPAPTTTAPRTNSPSFLIATPPLENAHTIPG
jgi:hypothetical protein